MFHNAKMKTNFTVIHTMYYVYSLNDIPEWQVLLWE